MSNHRSKSSSKSSFPHNHFHKKIINKSCLEDVPNISRNNRVQHKSFILGEKIDNNTSVRNKSDAVPFPLLGRLRSKSSTKSTIQNSNITYQNTTDRKLNSLKPLKITDYSISKNLNDSNSQNKLCIYSLGIEANSHITHQRGYSMEPSPTQNYINRLLPKIDKNIRKINKYHTERRSTRSSQSKNKHLEENIPKLNNLSKQVPNVNVPISNILFMETAGNRNKSKLRSKEIREYLKEYINKSSENEELLDSMLHKGDSCKSSNLYNIKSNKDELKKVGHLTPYRDIKNTRNFGGRNKSNNYTFDKSSKLKILNIMPFDD